MIAGIWLILVDCLSKLDFENALHRSILLLSILFLHDTMIILLRKVEYTGVDIKKLNESFYYLNSWKCSWKFGLKYKIISSSKFNSVSLNYWLLSRIIKNHLHRACLVLHWVFKVSLKYDKILRFFFTGKCDSYVEIKLLSEDKFTDNKTSKTHVQKETLFSRFDKTFNM